MTPDTPRTVDDAQQGARPMARTYASVIAVEVVVLVALWVLQVTFSR